MLTFLSFHMELVHFHWLYILNTCFFSVLLCPFRKSFVTIPYIFFWLAVLFKKIVQSFLGGSNMLMTTGALQFLENLFPGRNTTTSLYPVLVAYEGNFGSHPPCFSSETFYHSFKFFAIVGLKFIWHSICITNFLNFVLYRMCMNTNSHQKREKSSNNERIYQ